MFYNIFLKTTDSSNTQLNDLLFWFKKNYFVQIRNNNYPTKAHFNTTAVQDVCCDTKLH